MPEQGERRWVAEQIERARNAADGARAVADGHVQVLADADAIEAVCDRLGEAERVLREIAESQAEGQLDAEDMRETARAALRGESDD